MSKEYKRISVIRFSDTRILKNKKITATVAKQVRTYQPTYQLNPRRRFDVDRVQKLLQRLLNSELEEIEYNDKVTSELCISLAESIRDAVKELGFDRYRVITAVTIGQKRQQSVQMFHSFLWDPERDGFATCSFENSHIYANAVVYGIYLD